MTDETKALEVQKQEVMTSDDVERTRDCPCYVPRADIFETNDEIVVILDMPGAHEDSIDITLEKNVLTINGYVESDLPVGYSLSHGEYEVGDYQRSFTVSDKIDRDRIDATIRHGVLRLSLPKAGPAKTRVIPVKSSEKT